MAGPRGRAARSTLAVSLALLAALTAGPVGAAPAQRGDRLAPYLVTLAPAHGAAVDPERPAVAERSAGALVRRLRYATERAQRGLLRRLERLRADGGVGRIEPLWIVNAVAVTATPSAARELVGRADVVDVVPDTPLPIQPAAPEPHLDLIGTPILWAAGADGSGAVVASLDTGVDGTHPALAGRQVPGSGSWFDPYGQWPDGPVDVSGHGTWTLGAAVATEGLGVAPGARWIAARAFDDSQTATLSALHRGFQWVLDPDGDPATDDAPDVLLAPWTFSVPGCREELRPDVVALRAAGILPVFAAGNDGPGPGSDRSPANYPEALAVGVSDDLDHVLDMSARGPSSCAGDETFPDVVAPGDDLRVPDLFGGYASPSGTSMAAGVVAGAAAVLSEAEPELTPEERIQAVLGGALDLAPSGIDPVSGSGRLDLSGALAFVEASRGFSVRVDPPVLQVAPDGEGVTRLEVAPSFGYLGRVKLHVVSTLPPGVGVWFGRRRIDVPGSTSVRVEVGEDVAPGVFRVRIRARDDLRRTFVRLRVEVNPYG